MGKPRPPGTRELLQAPEGAGWTRADIGLPSTGAARAPIPSQPGSGFGQLNRYLDGSVSPQIDPGRHLLVREVLGPPRRGSHCTEGPGLCAVPRPPRPPAAVRPGPRAGGGRPVVGMPAARLGSGVSGGGALGLSPGKYAKRPHLSLQGPSRWWLCSRGWGVPAGDPPWRSARWFPFLSPPMAAPARCPWGEPTAGRRPAGGQRRVFSLHGHMASPRGGCGPRVGPAGCQGHGARGGHRLPL